jgi:hypothetical protein
MCMASAPRRNRNALLCFRSHSRSELDGREADENEEEAEDEDEEEAEDEDE